MIRRDRGGKRKKTDDEESQNSEVDVNKQVLKLEKRKKKVNDVEPLRIK